MKTGATVMLLGAFLLPHATVYRWQSYSVDGDTLYALKTVSTNEINIPIPERGAAKVLDKMYQVVAIDLTGKKNEPAPVSHHLQPAQPVGNDHLNKAFGYYEYIELKDNAAPILWGRKELKERLTQARGVDCAESEVGEVIYDHQDSRVLYLYCEKKDVAYRIEFPSMQAAAIPLGAAAGLPSDDSPGFFSTLGQKKVFVNVNRATFEIEIGAKGSARKIEKIDNNSIRPQRRSPKSLIGVADGLRIYQLTQLQEKTAQLSLESDQQAPRIYPLPVAIVTSLNVSARYLPRNNSVMWEVGGEITGKTVVYTLHLDSGVVNRCEVNVVD